MLLSDQELKNFSYDIDPVPVDYKCDGDEGCFVVNKEDKQYIADAVEKQLKDDKIIPDGKCTVNVTDASIYLARKDDRKLTGYISIGFSGMAPFTQGNINMFGDKKEKNSLSATKLTVGLPKNDIDKIQHLCAI